MPILWALQCHPLTNRRETMFSFTTPNNRYLVKSHGNGWAYEITCQETGENLWVQDSDAEQLREAAADFENEDAIADYFECLY